MHKSKIKVNNSCFLGLQLKLRGMLLTVYSIVNRRSKWEGLESVGLGGEEFGPVYKTQSTHISIGTTLLY